MYKDNSQVRIDDFVFPYGKLDPENDWVRLAALVPWEVAEEQFAARFKNNGHPAHPARMALGALLIHLAQPWVRPIVRGKAHASTEFGPKLHISLVDGYARIERLDFEPFNKSEGLWRAVARYRERYTIS